MHCWHPQQPKPDTQCGGPAADLGTAGHHIHLVFRVCCALTSPTQRQQSHPEHKETKPAFSPVHTNLLYMWIQKKIACVIKSLCFGKHDLRHPFFPILYSDRETLLYKADSIAKGKAAGEDGREVPVPGLPTPLPLSSGCQQRQQHPPCSHPMLAATSSPLRHHQLCQACSASKAIPTDLLPFCFTICNYCSFLCTPIRCYLYHQVHKLCSDNSRLLFHQPGQQCSNCHASILR